MELRLELELAHGPDREGHLQGLVEGIVDLYILYISYILACSFCSGRLQIQPHLPAALEYADPRRPATAGEADAELFPLQPTSLPPDMVGAVEHRLMMHQLWPGDSRIIFPVDGNRACLRGRFRCA